MSSGFRVAQLEIPAGDVYFTQKVPAGTVCFKPKRKPGRPPKTRRDVAAFMAYEWARSGRPLPGVDLTGVRSPQSAVVRLWESRNYIGMGDKEDARLIVVRGSHYLARGHWGSMVYEDGPIAGARVFAVPDRAVRAPGRGMYVDRLLSCVGWVWAYGEQEAVLADIHCP